MRGDCPSGEPDTPNLGGRTRRVPGVAISWLAGAGKSVLKGVGTKKGDGRNVGNAHTADHLTLNSRLPPICQGVFNCLGGARWAPTPLNPPPSGRRAGECAMRAPTRRRQADTQRALSQESGGTGVPSSIGGDDAKVPRKGSIEQVSRSVFAARGSPASGAADVS